jgi:glycosyltransferase involved in cell wall biosynthesis
MKSGNEAKSPGETEVSVVMAVKNEALHITEALHSILLQTNINFELIVVDDGSTDETAEILSATAAKFPRLRWMRNPRSGKCAAFNHGVQQALGRFVCIFAGDDVMPVGSLAARFACVRQLSDSAPVVGLCKLVTMSKHARFNGQLIPRRSGQSALSGVSPLMNRLALKSIFPVPENLPNEDTWMELAVLHMPNWTIVHSDIIGCQWRVHEGNSINMMGSFADYNRKITVRMQAFSLFFERHGSQLDARQQCVLKGKVQCEAARAKGSVWGVLTSPVGLTDRLRALSSTNAFWYGIRRRLYRLLSGW